MRIFNDMSALPDSARGGMVAIGNFDGVHRGHQALIEDARSAARKAEVPSGVLTFEPHPRRLLNPSLPPFRLTPAQAKARVIGGMGIDCLYVQQFDRAFAEVSARDFVERLLVEKLGVARVVVGYDFVFGHDRKGDADTIRELGVRHGFKVSSLDPITDADGTIFTSTRVREALIAGKPREAARILGREWEIEGLVEHGDGRGRTIDFPTANIRLGEYQQPADGIYAVRVGLTQGANVQWLKGAGYFGKRPTFGEGDQRLEVHLLDFDGDLYGKEIRVVFVEHLRGDRHFSNVEDLKAQMKKDCESARSILSGERAEAAR